MKLPSIALLLAIGLLFGGLVALPGGARGHEQETSVDWEVAYANIQVLAPPVFTHYTAQTLPLGGTRFAYTGVVGVNGYPTIPSGSDTTLATGDYIVVTWSFRYVALTGVRGDLFWITRLGLDFATVGRYYTCTIVPASPSCPSGNQWLGASSFPLVPTARYDATLVLRSIQPTFRHLHVGVSVQNVGNIPAAPTVSPIPAGGPTLYGIFTDAHGPVVEPLQGVNVAPFGDLTLLAPWPWAVAGFVAQVVIGFAFIGAMFLYGSWERKKEARA